MQSKPRAGRRVGDGDSSGKLTGQACRLHSEKRPLRGLLGTGRVAGPFRREESKSLMPNTLSASWGFPCCPPPLSLPDSGPGEQAGGAPALPHPAPAPCSPVPFVRALGDRHTQNGRSQHHVVADVRGDEDIA